MPVNTDKEIKANRPDIIIKDKKEKTCIMIDMSIPSERNVPIKEVEKLSKYKDLEIEVTKMWEMKTSIVPIVICSYYKVICNWLACFLQNKTITIVVKRKEKKTFKGE